MATTTAIDFSTVKLEVPLQLDSGRTLAGVEMAYESYGELAAAVGNPRASRAVGGANGANNIAVLIPCHRVIAANGALGGYAYGLEIKAELLRREKT